MNIDSYITQQSFDKLKQHFDDIKTNYRAGIKIYICTLNDLKYKLAIQPEFKQH